MFKILAVGGVSIVSSLSVLMVMTAGDMTIVIAAITTALISLIGAVFAGLASFHAARARNQSQAISQEIAVVKEDIHTVKVATNSMQDDMIKMTRLEAQEVGRQEGQKAAKEVAEAVAEAVAVVEAKKPTPITEAPKIAENLENIDEHTEATAKNTARTDANVRDLKDKT